MNKQFCRLVTKHEISDEDVGDFYDVVTYIMPAKVVTAYTEDDDKVSVEVLQYTSEDGEYVYEIVLGDQVIESEGDAIIDELNEIFDFDFDFEASIDV